jgi:hypothetical protein
MDTDPIKKDLQIYNFFIVHYEAPRLLVNPYIHVIFILRKK